MKFVLDIDIPVSKDLLEVLLENELDAKVSVRPVNEIQSLEDIVEKANIYAYNVSPSQNPDLEYIYSIEDIKDAYIACYNENIFK